MKTYNRKLGKQIFQVIDGVTYKLCNKCQQYKVMSADNFHHNKQAIKVFVQNVVSILQVIEL